MTQFNDDTTTDGVEGYWEELDGPNGRTLHVHLYGTNSALDVITDMTALKVKETVDSVVFRGVHVGFLSYAKRGIKIINTLPILDRLWITGHSLGGAIATLITYYYHKKGANVVCDVCGSPRVGGLFFRWDARKVSLMRVQIKRDPVAALPPWWMGFAHIGDLRLYRWQGEDVLASFIDRHMPAAYTPYVDYAL